MDEKKGLLVTLNKNGSPILFLGMAHAVGVGTYATKKLF